MSENNDLFNFDDILADFSSYSDSIANEGRSSSVKESEAKKEAFTEKEEIKSEPEFNINSSGPDFSEIFGDISPAETPRRNEPIKRAPRPANPYDMPQRQPLRPEDASRPAAPAQPRPQMRRPAANNRPGVRRPAGENPGAASKMAEHTQKLPSIKLQRPAPEKPDVKPVRPDSQPSTKAPEIASQQKTPERSLVQRGTAGILSIVFAVLSIFACMWMFVNIHPDSGTAVGNALKSKVNMVEKFDSYANNAASDALGELSYIPKIYTIAEDLNVAPKPNPANFGSTTDPQQVMKVIDASAALLGDQKVAFDPNANFVPGSEIKYYRDETILAIAWKEDINGKCCSCAEVKIAHGSQIRRKVAGDTYSVGKRYYASDMAKEANAVVAINGDFYDFRPIGITVFQRELFRFNPGKLDSCHITSGGDFIFTYADELTDEEYTRQFIKDNDIVFSLSFGPILIDNGEFRPVDGYPIGEVNTTYSRSAIGMLDKLHYMMMTVNYDVGYRTAATLNEIGQFMAGKNCHKAYALDGGQTSVLMMNGELVNHVDYGNERTMSDIIYFATAIPDKEAAK